MMRRRALVVAALAATVVVSTASDTSALVGPAIVSVPLRTGSSLGGLGATPGIEGG